VAAEWLQSPILADWPDSINRFARVFWILKSRRSEFTNQRQLSTQNWLWMKKKPPPDRGLIVKGNMNLRRKSGGAWAARTPDQLI